MSDKLSVSYCAHVADHGWLPYVSEGGTAGTEGEGRRLEAVRIKLVNAESLNVNIKYRTHVSNIGWQSYVYGDAIAGTTGESKQAEAIQIELEVGGNATEAPQMPGMKNKGLQLDRVQELLNKERTAYSVAYRVHMEDKGWSAWVFDGGTAGTTSESRRIEAIQVCISPKR